MMKVMPHPDGGRIDGGDASTVITCGANGPALALGDACSCDAECGSTHCVEGVCCNSSCSGGCQTCTAPERAGHLPRARGQIGATKSLRLSDGLRLPAAGWMGLAMAPAPASTTSATPASGAPAAVTRCWVPSPVTAPASARRASRRCSASRTAATRTPGPASRPVPPPRGASATPQHSCDLSTGSCGKVGIGAHCNGDGDCISGNCADSVCCNIACKGACVACNLPGRLGACSAIDSGKPDPRARLQGSGSGELRPQRDLRRRGRLRQLRPRHPVPRAFVHRQPPQHRWNVRRPRQVPGPRRAGLPSVPLHQRRLHQVVPDGDRLRPRNRLPPRDDRHL